MKVNIKIFKVAVNVNFKTKNVIQIKNRKMITVDMSLKKQ